MSYENPRLNLQQSMLEVISVMSEGNPGAISVLSQFLAEGPSIDPDDIFKGFGSIMGLDNLDLYRPKIWMLYKDVCKEDICTTICLLRSVQLGITTEQDIKHAVENYGEGLNLEDVRQKVSELLPNFNTNNLGEILCQ